MQTKTVRNIQISFTSIYTGDLKKSIAGMEFDDDTSEMTEEMLFDRHYKILKKLHHDSLVILDNFNVLPKDDSFFREFAQNDFQLLITTRCHPMQYPIMELKELNSDTELPELFYCLCPSAKEDALATKKIIQTIHSHTLTVVLSALSLSTSGMEAEELLYELQTCGLSISSSETVELTDYLPKLVERIEDVMKPDANAGQDKPYHQQNAHSCCDRALLLDYKAELFLIKNDYKSALKKRLKGVSVLEPYHTEDADQRTTNLLSNLYNNLSNTYLLMKKTKEDAEMLHTALTIRQEYVYLGLAESHDMLQQLMNLTNMLILSKNTDMAKQVLSAYESFVLKHEGTQTLDNGICQMMYGAISLSENKAKEAELHLLSAKTIISEVMGNDNDYAKTVYLYLNNLYTRWQKPEQALAYKNKYLECSRHY